MWTRYDEVMIGNDHELYSSGRETHQGTYTDRMWRGEEAGWAGVAKLLAEPAEHSAKPDKH